MINMGSIRYLNIMNQNIGDYVYEVDYGRTFTGTNGMGHGEHKNQINWVGTRSFNNWIHPHGLYGYSDMNHSDYESPATICGCLCIKIF